MNAIDWIRNPSLTPSGYKDSQVFVSVVTEIFEQARRGSKDPDKLRDLLTYLLLRRHPVTDADVPIDHKTLESYENEHTRHLKDVVVDTVGRYLSGKKSHPYAIMQLITESVTERRANWHTDEEVSLWILALWVTTQTLDLRDRLVCHACFKLYYESNAIALSNMDGEFNSDRLSIAVRVSHEISRLCNRIYSLDEMTSALSYFGAFASLIRAHRMLGKVNVQLNTLLREEIAWLQDIDKRSKSCSQLQT